MSSYYIVSEIFNFKFSKIKWQFLKTGKETRICILQEYAVISQNYYSITIVKSIQSITQPTTFRSLLSHYMFRP
jgi:hypothetical protein